MGGWIAFGLRRGRLTGFDPPTSFEDQASKARPCSTGGGVRVLHHDFEFLSLFYTHLDPDPPVQIHTLLLCGIFYLVAPTRSFFEIQENVRRSFISSLRVAVGTSASRDWIPIEQLNLDVVGAVIGGERERERSWERILIQRPFTSFFTDKDNKNVHHNIEEEKEEDEEKSIPGREKGMPSGSSIGYDLLPTCPLKDAEATRNSSG